jgi:phospholipid/cholesterol/gamma-HCH transport system substrate-binding protein
MSKSRVELKVGMFVLVGLVLLAAFVLLFSKGTAFWRGTFELRLKSENVGGIKPGSNILLAGVPVGRVTRAELAPDGKGVTIHLRILSKYQLYEDARFEIEQFGFLGDQYVAIYPGENKGRRLGNGDEVLCRSPFNLQETVAVAAETISRIGRVTTNVDAAVTDVRRAVLNEQRLQNLGGAIDHFALLTTDAMQAVSNVNALVASNALPVTLAVSNLNALTLQLSPIVGNVNHLITNNEPTILAALKNIETASALLTNLLHELEQGQGAAGRLLRDEQMGANLAAVAQNLMITTSNLNQRGLWSILWRPKPPRTNQTDAIRLEAPRDPYN